MSVITPRSRRGTSFLIPSSKNSPGISFIQFRTYCFTSLSVEIFFPPMWVFREVKRWKSEGAKSEEYAGWFKMSQPNESKIALLALAVCGRALSCNKHTPFVNISLRLFWIALLSCFRVSQYRAALIVFAWGRNSIKMIPLRSQNLAMIFLPEIEVFNYFGSWRTGVPSLWWLFDSWTPWTLSPWTVLIREKSSVGVFPSARMTARTSHLAGFLIDIFYTNGHYKASFRTNEVRRCSVYSGKPTLPLSVANPGKKLEKNLWKQFWKKMLKKK